MADRLAYLGLLTVLAMYAVGCGSKKTSDPQVVAGFVERYESAYAERDRETIMLMIDWPGVDEELRTYTKESVYPEAGYRVIRSAEAVPYELSVDDTREHDGKTIELATEPTHRIKIVFEPIDRNAQPERYELFAVETGDGMKLCGWAFAE